MIWSLAKTHDVTGAKWSEGFWVSSPHPQILRMVALMEPNHY